MKITEDDIVEALGGLPENKKHCSNLGVKALRSAIENYYSRKVNNK
jgi:nitrogen fixation NifU-like protein